MAREIVELKYDSCIVTGGAGFIGSHICEEALRQGKRVVCIDNLVAGKEENIKDFLKNPNFTFAKADVASLNDILPYFGNIDVVFHNAASKCTICRDDPKKDLLVNAWGAWCVCEAASRMNVKKVIHASTGSIYGDSCYFPQDEKHPYKPKSFYGVSKLAGERYLEAFKEYYNLRYAIIRYFHVYGPRQESADWGGVIPIFIRRAYNDMPLIIYGDGSQVRSFTYVKDDVYANFVLANTEESNGETYNAASGIKVTISDLAKMVLRIMGKESLKIEFRDWRQGDIKHFEVDNSKICKFGIKFTTDFEKGLSETINWYLKYLVSKKEGIEI